jgi:peptide deformylase
MTIRKILMYPEDRKKLRKKSTLIESPKDAKELIQDLKDTLAANPGAGLAAPQIGVHKCVIVVRFGQDEGEMDNPIGLINPKIIEEGELVAGFDGCLSIPGLFTYDTPRPSWLIITAINETGKKIKLKLSGIDARLVHHEIDHLEGIVYLDRLPQGGKLYKSETSEEDSSVPG